MRKGINKAITSEEIETQERCHILEIANDSDDEFVSIARDRVEAGVSTAWHCLKGVCERYLIVAGFGRVDLGGMDPVDVSVGDVVRIPLETRNVLSTSGPAISSSIAYVRRLSLRIATCP